MDKQANEDTRISQLMVCLIQLRQAQLKEEKRICGCRICHANFHTLAIAIAECFQIAEPEEIANSLRGLLHNKT